MDPLQLGSSFYASIPTQWPVQFADKTECTTYDFLQYPDSDEVEMVEGTVEGTSLPDYFANETPVPSSSRKAVCGLRLLVTTLRYLPNGNVISLDRTSFDLIKSHFDLHDLFIDLFVPRNTQAFLHTSARKVELCPVLLFKSNGALENLYQLSLKYNPSTNITSGFLVFIQDTQAPYTTITSLLSSMYHQFKSCTHPLLLPIFLAERDINICWRNFQITNNELAKIQNQTGQHPTGPQIDVMGLDFTDITSVLNFNAEICSSGIFSLKGFASSLIVLENWGRSLSMSMDGIGEKEKKAFLDAQGMMFKKTDHLRSVIEAILLQGEYLEKRIETYRQLIYVLMAQKDSRTNINLAQSSAAIAKAAKEDSAVMRQIALETKRDSSAMKTIAMLTMVFLPATSIAAIFAMPVIKWDRWDGKVTAFSLYWVVTLPLTLLVFMVWGAAVVLPWRSWIVKRGVWGEKEEDGGEGR